MRSTEPKDAWPGWVSFVTRFARATLRARSNTDLATMQKEYMMATLNFVLL